MSDQVFYIFQLASTFSVVLPLTIGFWKFRKTDWLVKGFLFFLIVGFATDLAGWYFYLSKDGTSNLYIRHVYDFIEPVFLFWFLSLVATNQLIKRFFMWFIIILVPCWAVRFFYLDAMAIYRSTFQVFVAFGACFSLIQIVETKKEVTEQLIFWLLLGVFFYCFSTFFFMGILISKLAKIWYAHNIINILTNLIYFIGFLRAKNFIAVFKNNE
jgi:hypothetical protein